MARPTVPSSTRLLASSLGIAALLAALLWSLGAGLDLASALFRSLIAAFLMFLLGLVLGRSLEDTLKRESPPGAPGKKEENDKKAP